MLTSMELEIAEYVTLDYIDMTIGLRSRVELKSGKLVVRLRGKVKLMAKLNEANDAIGYRRCNQTTLEPVQAVRIRNKLGCRYS